MRIFISLIAAFLLPLTAQAADVELPSGWRPLMLSELKDTTNYVFRSREKDLLSVTADFDGDGIKDSARFLVKNDGSEFALFITTHHNKELTYYKQHSTKTLSEIARLGVSLASPGEYDTACGKGYWDCSSKEPPKIKLKFSGIDFFVFESAGSLIYWDSDQQKFEEIATSD